MQKKKTMNKHQRQNKIDEYKQNGQKTPQMNKEQNYQCVCQICTCGMISSILGKHKCPPQKMLLEKQSTHKHDYQPYYITNNTRSPCQHYYQQRHYDPELLKTNYESSFKEYTNKVQNPQQHYHYQMNTGKFYDQTEYKTQYLKKPSEIKAVVCQHNYPYNRSKFEGKTTYQQQYTKKKSDRAEIKQHTHYIPDNKFKDDTTYKQFYKTHQLQQQRLGCKCHHTIPYHRHFQNKTTYNDQYKKKTPYVCPHCPILDLPSYPRQCSRGKQHVHYSPQKKQWE